MKTFLCLLKIKQYTLLYHEVDNAEPRILNEMKIAQLGHVALKVSNIEKSKAFYHVVLGLPYSGNPENESMVFFQADRHHNLALFLADTVDNTNSTLDHVAFKLEGGKQELELAQVELESNGIKVTSYSHREVESLYLNDPDGNQIELYVHLEA